MEAKKFILVCGIDVGPITAPAHYTNILDALPYLRSVELRRDVGDDVNSYPFCLPIVTALTRIDFHSAVTFIVGENGAGKSTLLEAIVASMGLNVEGGNRNTLFATESTHSVLWSRMKTVKSFRRPNDWYFLRAESFYNFATYIDRKFPAGAQGYGGKSLHNQSHGESFMAVLNHKLRGKGLYFFDEPEAALSPTRQMAALIEIDRLVRDDSQFIIATHSPILMSYPNAKILQIEEDGLREVAYTDTEHFKVTQNFLNHHEIMVRRLLES